MLNQCSAIQSFSDGIQLVTKVKNIAQIEHSRHRSLDNFIANALSAIAAYYFFNKKPAIDINFINEGHLMMF